MKVRLFVRFILCFSLLAAVVAPFTFLQPKPSTVTETLVSEDSVDVATPTEVAASIDVTEQVEEKSVVKAKPVKKEDPLHQVDLPDFSAISDIPTKKRKFFGFIRPAVEAKNKELAEDRSKLEHWKEQMSLGLGLTESEQTSLQSLVKAYRVNEGSSTLQQINDLLFRVDVIPAPLVLVQAANESAWGTSRFARIGLNFFGIWCYKRGCGMVPGGRDTGAKHEVASFQSVDDSISGYFNNINKHNAYHVFRTIRAELRATNQPLSPEILVTGLLPYSERGTEYVSDLSDMLRYNKRYLYIPQAQQTASAN